MSRELTQLFDLIFGSVRSKEDHNSRSYRLACECGDAFRCASDACELDFLHPRQTMAASLHRNLKFQGILFAKLTLIFQGPGPQHSPDRRREVPRIPSSESASSSCQARNSQTQGWPQRAKQVS